MTGVDGLIEVTPPNPRTSLRTKRSGAQSELGSSVETTTGVCIGHDEPAPQADMRSDCGADRGGGPAITAAWPVSGTNAMRHRPATTYTHTTMLGESLQSF
jgi:hypothetical protein